MRLLAAFLFAASWILVHVVWASLQVMGTLMANDLPTVSPDQHLVLIGGGLGGVALTGISGIPATWAILRRQHRKPLVLAFFLLLGSGLILQLSVFLLFYFRAGS